ncbi:hypothetical protein BDV37DRAFT_242156 [Aspergillus pseudonomiae]|uniref:Uncharacterized protein n=1 Tax=Aspergillus pseudonomiae TaxID=1506151 RepID=A0A5N7DKD0_9EURO|nr:uncharacterized protein BDV37DRAFT_242156 [Aspergillus pseudonomiae]KAE8406892.1 hypothetical protein BDV37DRAFT_242156 [Aspergillus pseudonomiae]
MTARATSRKERSPWLAQVCLQWHVEADSGALHGADVATEQRCQRDGLHKLTAAAHKQATQRANQRSMSCTSS